MENIGIDLGSWNGVFAVPNSVVDEHIKLAGAAQLKVLLFVLRHSGEAINTEQLGAELNMHPADVSDSINFWINCGLLKRQDNGVSPSDAESSAVSELADTPTPAVENQRRQSAPLQDRLVRADRIFHREYCRTRNLLFS